MKIYSDISRLLYFALKNNIITDEDVIYCRNEIMSYLNLESWIDNEYDNDIEEYPQNILNRIIDYAIKNNIIENTIDAKDLFDTKIMGALSPFPREIIDNFNYLAKNNSIEDATDYFYNFSKKINYIRTERIAKNIVWNYMSNYGNLEITINLSKPEKDPKEIAKQKELSNTSKKNNNYPKCLLCYENIGYNNRLDHPARKNLRVLPLVLGDEKWYMQYSPYVYYNEHAIVFCKEHRPMVIDEKAIKRILDYVELFPHYFLGSNADLPIVGGSILSHDHYQGGRHEFPMAKAKLKKQIIFKGFEDVESHLVEWPLSVIRIKHKNKEKLLELSKKIMETWKNYSDEIVNIISHTNGERHNTVTPVARKRGELFELDIVLRNNRTDEEHALGIFHPKKDYHNIKKENIGVIEVMGLAVLPGRLKKEMDTIANYIIDSATEKDLIEKIRSDADTEKHCEWFLKMKDITFDKMKNYKFEEIINNILYKYIGITFEKCLEDSGVYKNNLEGEKGFLRFIDRVNSL